MSVTFCTSCRILIIRRLRVFSLFKKEGERIGVQFELVADYLNISLNCIRNNYNRHVTELKKALNLLQPITTEMNSAFKSFKDSNPTPLEDVNSRFKRYVRTSLDQEKHEKEYQEWTKEFEKFQKESKSPSSFDEVYGRNATKRKIVE